MALDILSKDIPNVIINEVAIHIKTSGKLTGTGRDRIGRRNLKGFPSEIKLAIVSALK